MDSVGKRLWMKVAGYNRSSGVGVPRGLGGKAKRRQVGGVGMRMGVPPTFWGGSCMGGAWPGMVMFIPRVIMRAGEDRGGWLGEGSERCGWLGSGGETSSWLVLVSVG